MITTTVLVLGQRTGQDDVADLFHHLRKTLGTLPGSATPGWNHVPHPGTGHRAIDDCYPGHFRYQVLSRAGHAYPADDLPVVVKAVYRADGFAIVEQDPELDDPDHLIRIGMDYGTFDAHGVLVDVVTAWTAGHGLRRVWSDDHRAAWSAGPWTSGR